jgi:pimeloyl-ACP methyl ester carboxylesterase
MTVAARQARPVAIDLPGVGESSGAATDGSQRQLAAVVHELITTLGLREVTLVGQDVGGMIAYAYLRAYQDLARVVIMDVVLRDRRGADDALALEGNAAALQRRLPNGWELAPYAGDGSALRARTCWSRSTRSYGTRTRDGQPAGLPQLSYIAFVSQARNRATGALGHLHWFTYTEDPAGVPGRYGDGKLAEITRSQTFTKQRRGETQVRETFPAVADSGAAHLSLAYQQGVMAVWVTADKPNLPLYSAKDPRVERWYQEDQVMDVVRSEPLNVDGVSELSLDVQGELGDVFDGNERVVAVVIQRPYMRQVYVP